jgi:hypothetical protein
MAATSIPVPNSGEVVASSWGAAVAQAHNGIQSGTVTTPAITSGSAFVAVTFPRPFSAPPVVVAVGPGNTVLYAQVGLITNTGFTAYIRDSRDSPPSGGTAVINWIAVGLP